MSQIYLAINYGCYEGWKLEPHDTAFEALDAVKNGETYGQEWKILRDLEITVIDNENEQPHPADRYRRLITALDFLEEILW